MQEVSDSGFQGQCTPIAIANIGYKYYYVFVICNFTNALFFWLILPETARRPLEEMNYIFSNAPWVVPGSKKTQYQSYDLEQTLEEKRRVSQTEVMYDK